MKKIKPWKVRAEEARIALVKATMKMKQCGQYTTANLLAGASMMFFYEYKEQTDGISQHKACKKKSKREKKMSRTKLEIKSRMNELQKEFVSLNAELKELQAAEHSAGAIQKFAEYKFRIGSYGYEIEAEDKVVETNDDERRDAHMGMSGLVYSNISDTSDYGYILMKDAADYTRTKKVLQMLNAVQKLKDDKEKNKEQYLKFLLGETSEQLLPPKVK